MVTQEIKELVANELHAHELIKFGTFTLKSGIESPFYIDLREVQSYPDTLRAVTMAYGGLLESIDDSVFVAGVPEAGVPLATAVGYEYRRKLLQPRKVVKEHGTKSSVEGAFAEGDTVVLIDDLIAKGDSKLEAIDQVEKAGLKVHSFLVLIDRQQGGMELVAEKGYKIEAVMTITELIDTLKAHDKISNEQYDTILTFISNN